MATAIVTPYGHGMGRRRDDLDPADFRYVRRQPRAPAYPAATLNRQYMPPVLDQGQLGSCTAHSACNIYDYHRIRGGLSPLQGARLKQYYNARVLENTVSSDSGASIRNAIKAMAQWGIAPERMWPYDISRFRERPPEPVYVEAEKNQVVRYYRVPQTRDDFRDALSAGLIIEFGFVVFPQYDNLGPDGVVKMPGPGDRQVGSHSQVMVDYVTTQNGSLMFPCQNSWGTGHGDQGYAYFPEAFVLNPELCDDFWAVELIEREEPAPPPPPPVPPNPWIHHVGDDIKAEMLKWGDVPLNREDYPTNEFNQSVGWSIIWAKNPTSGEYVKYWYLEFEKIVIREPLP